ncbi:MAG TPA: hypothetical protein VGK47_04510 [Nitrososphaeraceae archaeon]
MDYQEYEEYVKRNSGWVKPNTSKLGQISKEDERRINLLFWNAWSVFDSKKKETKE